MNEPGLHFQEFILFIMSFVITSVIIAFAPRRASRRALTNATRCCYYVGFITCCVLFMNFKNQIFFPYSSVNELGLRSPEDCGFSGIHICSIELRSDFKICQNSIDLFISNKSKLFNQISKL